MTAFETIERIAQTVAYNYPRFEMTEAQAVSLARYGLAARPIVRTDDGCIIFVELSTGQARLMYVIDPAGVVHRFPEYYGVGR